MRYNLTKWCMLLDGEVAERIALDVGRRQASKSVTSALDSVFGIPNHPTQTTER